MDARASYGIGLETFALGFPIHFDWAWRTLLNKDWEDLRFAAYRRQLGVPQAAVRDVDWIRLLDWSAGSLKVSGYRSIRLPAVVAGGLQASGYRLIRPRRHRLRLLSRSSLRPMSSATR